MTSGPLIVVAVRLFGVLIGLQAFMAVAEWIARYPSIAWHPRVWGIYVLIAAWLLVAFLMIVWPRHAARGIAGDQRQSGTAIERSTVEEIGLRLLGVYILVQAAAETAHIGVHQVVFQLYLSELWPVWVDTSPKDMVSMATASVKTIAGCCLIMGASRVQAAMC
jgi:hypothetical protein